MREKYLRSLCAKSLQSCPILCDPVNRMAPGSAVQARVLEWVAIPSPGDLPDLGIEPTSLMSPALASGFFTTSTTWEALQKSVFNHSVVSDSLRLHDYSLPGFSVHGIVQAGILEGFDIPPSRGSIQPRD